MASAGPDGVAFRFYLPRQRDVREFKLTSESSWFRFADNHHVWAADYGKFTTHQEAEFTEWMTFEFADLSTERGHLVLRWENLALPIRLETNAWR